MQTQPAKRSAGRPKETVNGAAAAAHVKSTHGMRCSNEVRAYAMGMRSCCPIQGARMRRVLDEAVGEAKLAKRKTVTMQDLERAVRAESNAPPVSAPIPVPSAPIPIRPRAQPPPSGTPAVAAVAYDREGRKYEYPSYRQPQAKDPHRF